MAAAALELAPVASSSSRPFVYRHSLRNKYDDQVTPLFNDDGPWEIKKKLKKSDVGKLSRLLLPHDTVQKYIFRYWDEERVQQWLNDIDGYPMKVMEFDTLKVHELVFKNWKSNNSYVLQGEWISKFVKPMGLEVDDEIGMFYDSTSDRFVFKLLKKHA